MNKATRSAPPYVSPSFNELCEQTNATFEERDELAWHLAMFRAKRTYFGLRRPADAEGAE